MPRLLTSSVLASAIVCASAPAFAQFNPGPNPITTTVGAQTLTNATGTVDAGGRISISVTGPALAITGTSTLVNNGTIENTGSGGSFRAIDSNALSNLTITNNGTISSVDTDAFRVNTAGSSVSLINAGTIQVTDGGQAIDWAAITTGTNTLTNQATGVITAVGEDAVRPGQNGIINNSGLIKATPTGGASPSGSDGIDLRTQKNVTVTNTGTIEGRHGIATDGANVGPSSLTVTNNAGSIQAVNGSGINVDGANTSVTANVINLAGAAIKGGVLAAATEADGDGIDVDGVLTLTNAGDVLGLGAKGAGNNAEGVAAGGGTITNQATGKIIGSTLAADAPNGDPTKAGNGILIDDSDGGSAVAATTITNSGLIEGKSGFAVKVVGTFDDTVTNNAGGTLRGATTEAAVQTGGGADTVVNRGTISNTNSLGKAIDLQDGDDTLIIEGGAASFVGGISGGDGFNTFILDPGAGNLFSFGGEISSFGLVDVKSGLVTLSGSSTYTGETRVSGGSLTLDGASRLLWDGTLGTSLALGGGTLAFLNAAGVESQVFTSFDLDDSSTIDLGQSSLTFRSLGDVAANKTLTIVDFLEGSDFAFRLLGTTYDANPDFLALLSGTTINGNSATYRVVGDYTWVQPVPEPSTMVLIGLTGLPALAARVRARRRSRTE